jgi:hypothetical protein
MAIMPPVRAGTAFPGEMNGVYKKEFLAKFAKCAKKGKNTDYSSKKE